MRPVPDEKTAPVRSNPDILGEDLARLGWMAVGLVVTAFVNDKVVHPLAQQVVPATRADKTSGKVADTVTTYATAYAVGEGAGMLLGSAIGRNMKLGGMVLGTGKGISVVVPNFSISAKYPEIGIPRITEIAPAPANGKIIPLPVKAPAVGVEAI